MIKNSDMAEEFKNENLYIVIENLNKKINSLESENKGRKNHFSETDGKNFIFENEKIDLERKMVKDNQKFSYDIDESSEKIICSEEQSNRVRNKTTENENLTSATANSLSNPKENLQNYVNELIHKIIDKKIRNRENIITWLEDKLLIFENEKLQAGTKKENDNSSDSIIRINEKHRVSDNMICCDQLDEIETTGNERIDFDRINNRQHENYSLLSEFNQKVNNIDNDYDETDISTGGSEHKLNKIRFIFENFKFRSI